MSSAASAQGLGRRIDLPPEQVRAVRRPRAMQPPPGERDDAVFHFRRALAFYP
jgi:hypothetical protein